MTHWGIVNALLAVLLMGCPSTTATSSPVSKAEPPRGVANGTSPALVAKEVAGISCRFAMTAENIIFGRADGTLFVSSRRDATQWSVNVGMKPGAIAANETHVYVGCPYVDKRGEIVELELSTRKIRQFAKVDHCPSELVVVGGALFGAESGRNDDDGTVWRLGQGARPERVLKHLSGAVSVDATRGLLVVSTSGQAVPGFEWGRGFLYYAPWDSLPVEPSFTRVAAQSYVSTIDATTDRVYLGQGKTLGVFQLGDAFFTSVDISELGGSITDLAASEAGVAVVVTAQGGTKRMGYFPKQGLHFRGPCIGRSEPMRTVSTGQICGVKMDEESLVWVDSERGELLQLPVGALVDPCAE